MNLSLAWISVRSNMTHLPGAVAAYKRQLLLPSPELLRLPSIPASPAGSMTPL